MAELYGLHDELPADIADAVLEDEKPVNEETKEEPEEGGFLAAIRHLIAGDK